MSLQAVPILFLVCCLLASCSAPVPTWRTRATELVEDLGQRDAPKLLSQDYQNLLETFEHGEALLYVQKNEKSADLYYLLVLQKGEILREQLKQLKELKLAEERKRVAEERKRSAEKAARAAEERLMREAAEAVERQRALDRLKSASDAMAAKPTAVVREPPLPQPPSHTVRRGETLPQIAARTEIYNDSSLWPLIYRANRDQIRDPKQLWPGQILKIPRHFTREEAIEAKRYSAKK